jgi:D-specific alpha-keto acid dehydrogenase
MTSGKPARTATRHAPPAANWSGPSLRTTGLTVYGCGQDEAALFREIAPRFGVAPTLTHEPLSEANVALARGNRCVSVDHRTMVTNAALRALTETGVAYVSTRSIGCNHIDVEHARSLGLTVDAVSYSPDSVADYTVMLVLMALRHAKTIIRRTDLHDYRLLEARGRELRDLTVGVVGTGRIGAAVVARLRGFGCRVLATDTRPTIEVEHVPLDDLLQQSDIVTLHVPLDAGTHHLLDHTRIGRLKPGAIVVNTGRGGLVDTAALVAALESGRLGGAALDVLEGEDGIFYADWTDRPVEHPLLLRLQELPNVVISPHSAFSTDHAVRDMVQSSIANCLEFESRAQHG